MRGLLRGGLAAICMTAVGALAPVASADEASWLYDPNVVVEIDLGIEPAGLEALEEKPTKHVPGTFTARVDGEVVGTPLDEVGIRLKGSSGSFRPLTRKPAFKVKFDKFVDDQLFFGLEGITLNNMVQDPSMVHEALSYDLFRSMGLTAPRTGYAFTRLNGEVIGVHANIEQYDEVSLPSHFPSTGHLYENDLPGVDVLPGRAAEFEVDEGDEEDLADLEALIAAANDEGGDWSDGMAAVADLGQMARFWAVERFVAHWDGYAGTLNQPNNYFLHSDADGVFRMLPWGADQTWGRAPRGAIVSFDAPSGGVMFNRCLADEGCRLLYDEALAGIEAVFPALGFLGKARAYATTLAPYQALEPKARREHSSTRVRSAVKAVEKFIAKRPIRLSRYLGTYEDPTSDPPSGHGGHGERSPVRPVSRILTHGLDSARREGGRIQTTVRTTVPGDAILRVRVHRDGRWASACSVRVAARPQRALKLSCRLPARVLAARSRRAQRLLVELHFVADSGERQTSSRVLRLPRLH